MEIYVAFTWEWDSAGNQYVSTDLEATQKAIIEYHKEDPYPEKYIQVWENGKKIAQYTFNKETLDFEERTIL